VTLRARWVTLSARWVTLRARWVTLRARWVTLRARWVTNQGRPQKLALSFNPNASAVPKMNMFEHVEGCTMCRVLGFEHFVLPDGKVMHCYHPKRALADEVRVEAEAAPAEPTTLAALGRESLPDVRESVARLLDMSEHAFPNHYKPKPMAGPKPGSHSTHVTDDTWACCLDEQAILMAIELQVRQPVPYRDWFDASRTNRVWHGATEKVP
jgi:hypothetical protein